MNNSKVIKIEKTKKINIIKKTITEDTIERKKKDTKKHKKQDNTKRG